MTAVPRRSVSARARLRHPVEQALASGRELYAVTLLRRDQRDQPPHLEAPDQRFALAGSDLEKFRDLGHRRPDRSVILPMGADEELFSPDLIHQMLRGVHDCWGSNVGKELQSESVGDD